MIQGSNPLAVFTRRKEHQQISTYRYTIFCYITLPSFTLSHFSLIYDASPSQPYLTLVFLSYRVALRYIICSPFSEMSQVQ